LKTNEALSKRLTENKKEWRQVAVKAGKIEKLDKKLQKKVLDYVDKGMVHQAKHKLDQEDLAEKIEARNSDLTLTQSLNIAPKPIVANIQLGAGTVDQTNMTFFEKPYASPKVKKEAREKDVFTHSNKVRLEAMKQESATKKERMEKYIRQITYDGVADLSPE